MYTAQTLILTSIIVSAPALAVQYLTAEGSQHAMFPTATTFREVPVHLTLQQMNEVQKIAGLPARSVAWRVVAAYQGDTLLGHVVLDDVIGKFELISYAVGFNPDASIRQVDILNYRESHGSEINNPAWRRQFLNKTVQTGIRAGDDIATISGATLSCNHVTDGVRRIAAIVQVVFGKAS